MRSVEASLIVVACSVLVTGVAKAQQSVAPPSVEAAVQRACDAAGGLEAFSGLGVLVIATKSEEVTQEGQVTTTVRTNYLVAPGPVPGRFEYPEQKVVAADDGTGGWAVMDGRPDSRFATTVKVRRSLQTTLFPVLLPFSLTWQGVAVQSVAAAQLKGRPVWRLSVVLPRTFFDNPQISTNWTVLLDRNTFAVLQAESPFTDLGKGVTADGMRYTRLGPVKVGGVTLYNQQKIVGLNELGQEKAHSKIDRLQYRVISSSEAAGMFANPIPPDKRPKPPAIMPPPAAPPRPQG